MEETDQVHFTDHAKHAISERNINISWIEETISNPEMRIPDPVDRTAERFYRKIPDKGNRVLRVVINTTTLPWRVVSVFFDRTMKGKI